MSPEERLRLLEGRISELERQLQEVADVQAIERLQYQYGYYLDKCLYEEVVQLFAHNSEVHFLRGIFKGIEGVRRLYLGRFKKRWAAGGNGPVYGHLLDHPQLQPVIHVAPDGLSARARFRSLMQVGVHRVAADTHPAGAFQRWESGLYENQYVKEDGRWKIKVLNYRNFWLASYEEGWANAPIWEDYLSVCYPEDPDGPDELEEPAWSMWPETSLFPFHYPHPITGQWVESTGGYPPREGPDGPAPAEGRPTDGHA
ncbi:MAG TPA: nuclear transport factor 2 family protein [Candidatus Dormibacteraeota bacterium]|nr:nuclear transport factor 2 family protein [Candidatus Dormibacteraeota bacterium]